jgi:non-ribosomal peptide synthetase component E (peptide arylation enzyme)
MPGPEGNISTEKLRSICKEKLASYKIPKKFNVQCSLPMLPVGKIDKQALKKAAAASRGKNDNKNSG